MREQIESRGLSTETYSTAVGGSINYTSSARIVQVAADFTELGCNLTNILDVVGGTQRRRIKGILREVQVQQGAPSKHACRLSSSPEWFMLKPERMMHAAMLVQLYCHQKKTSQSINKATQDPIANAIICRDVYRTYLQLTEATPGTATIHIHRMFTLLKFYQIGHFVLRVCNTCQANFLVSQSQSARSVCQACQVKSQSFCKNCGTSIPYVPKPGPRHDTGQTCGSCSK